MDTNTALAQIYNPMFRQIAWHNGVKWCHAPHGDWFMLEEIDFKVIAHIKTGSKAPVDITQRFSAPKALR